MGGGPAGCEDTLPTGGGGPPGSACRVLGVLLILCRANLSAEWKAAPLQFLGGEMTKTLGLSQLPANWVTLPTWAQLTDTRSEGLHPHPEGWVPPPHGAQRLPRALHPELEE